MVKAEQSEGRTGCKHNKQAKSTDVSGVTFEEILECRWCTEDFGETMNGADADECSRADDCSHYGCITDRITAKRVKHRRFSFKANGDVVNDADDNCDAESIEFSCLKKANHQQGRNGSEWHKSNVSSWLKWLDEPELMIREGSSIQSTSTDDILAEINASMV